jgi:ParB-like chromosome segregation protein Spo0J
VDRVEWIALERVQSNDYNPNSVASKELELLALSIRQDGYTQPLVTYYDASIDKYIIVDGFHRFLCCTRFIDIHASTGGFVPCVVLDKPIESRMASTVRHNRARGKHSVAGMSRLVLTLIASGKSDEDVCVELGMESEELTRLKHVTGFSKLFDAHTYTCAWENEKMLKKRVDWERKQMAD